MPNIEGMPPARHLLIMSRFPDTMALHNLYTRIFFLVHGQLNAPVTSEEGTSDYID